MALVREQRQTKIALISDRTAGGAAAACARLLQGLRGRNKIACAWLSVYGEPRAGAALAPEWQSLPRIVLARLIQRGFRRRPGIRDQLVKRLEFLANGRHVMAMLRGQKPDLVNLHNLHDAFSFSFAAVCARLAPVVWTLHDMWLLTGYCCYSGGCRQYRDGCRGECPELGRWGMELESPMRGWEIRQRFFSVNRRRIVLVTPSDWLRKIAIERLGDAVRVEHIPYGVDTEIYRPVEDRDGLRAILGLPGGKKIVLFGADTATDPRKGVRQLNEAVTLLRARSGDSFEVVAFGGSSGKQALPAGMRPLGLIRDERLLAMYYAAADVFVLPSLADNLPNTLIEAASTATPCVTSNVGGCPEVVRDGETGFVAEAGNAARLAEAIGRVLTMPEKDVARMRRACRQVAEQDYALQTQARRYERLFKAMTSSTGT